MNIEFIMTCHIEDYRNWWMVFHISCFCCGRYHPFVVQFMATSKGFWQSHRWCLRIEIMVSRGLSLRLWFRAKSTTDWWSVSLVKYSHHVLFFHISRPASGLLREFFMFGYRNDPYLHDFMHEASPIRYLYRQVNYYSVPSSQPLG